MDKPMATEDMAVSGIPNPAPGTPGRLAKKRAPRDLGNLSLIAGLCFVALAGLLLAAGVISGRGAQPSTGGLSFTIPAGASKTIARPGFDSAIQIPTDIRFDSPAEAVITVKNLDSVTHRAGPFLVGAGQTFTQRFPEPGRYPIVCTVDPLETVVVTGEG